jgi:hypothetical protein
LSGPPWKSLLELNLFGFHFISTELSSHLVSHPTIEILSLRSCKFDQPLVHSTIAVSRPLKFIMGSLLNDVFLDSLEQCGSGPNLDKLITLYNCGSDLGRLITRLSVAPTWSGWISGSKTKLSAFISLPELLTDKSIWPVPTPTNAKGNAIPQFKLRASLRKIQNVFELSSTLCPNLRKMDWYIDNELDMLLAVIIERNGSHGTWSLCRMERGRQIEGSVYTLWGAVGQGSFEL